MFSVLSFGSLPREAEHCCSAVLWAWAVRDCKSPWLRALPVLLLQFRNAAFHLCWWLWLWPWSPGHWEDEGQVLTGGGVLCGNLSRNSVVLLCSAPSRCREWVFTVLLRLRAVLLPTSARKLSVHWNVWECRQWRNSIVESKCVIIFLQKQDSDVQDNGLRVIFHGLWSGTIWGFSANSFHVINNFLGYFYWCVSLLAEEGSTEMGIMDHTLLELNSPRRLELLGFFQMGVKIFEINT